MPEMMILAMSARSPGTRWRNSACGSRAAAPLSWQPVIYPGLPGDLEELVLMCWLHGGEEYEVSGGGERLLAATRVLAARSR